MGALKVSINLKLTCAVFSLFAFVHPASALATDQKMFLKIEPNRCIALRQGQTCYQKLTFRWFTPKGDDYCLYQLPSDQPVLCWHGNEILSYKDSFQFERSTVYQIRAKGENTPLVESNVKVAWVYKTTRKNYSEWRLF